MPFKTGPISELSFLLQSRVVPTLDLYASHDIYSLDRVDLAPRV